MKKPRFILMYDFLTELGGLEKLMMIHAKFLKNCGFPVLILFGDIKKDMVDKEVFESFEIRDYGLNGRGPSKILANLLGINKLKKIIKKEDILVSYSYPINFLIRKFKNKKIQYMNHYPNFLYLSFKEKIIWANNSLRKMAVLSSLLIGIILKKIDKKLVDHNKLIFANSKNTKKKIDNVYKINSIVSYPPVHEDIKPVKKSDVKKKYNLKNYVYAPGRIIPDKHFDWLIESFSKVKNKSIGLVITGQGEERDIKKLKNLTKKLKIEEKVKFLGIVPKKDLIGLYSEAIVCAFAAPGEDFGLVPVESISCGTPVISWKDGSGPQETITENVNGLLAEPYNLEDFAKKLNIAINKKWDKPKILESSKKFSEKKIEKEFIKSIETVISFANQE